jgi:hypothetical protein
MTIHKRFLSLVIVCTMMATVAHSEEMTVCPMGGPTPGYRAIRFDLPQGSTFLGLEPHGSRATRVVSDDTNWHLASGVFIVNAQTLALEAYRIEASGTAPRALVVTADGTQLVRQPTTAPDGPFYHTAAYPRSGLPAGSYYAIGFGSDGGTTTPNEFWSYDVRIEGHHSCTSIGNGTIFDVDNTEFTGGTQVYAHGAGKAEGISYSMPQPGSVDVVVGLMDAAVQGSELAGTGGEATLGFQTPLGSGLVDDSIQSFVSKAGPHEFEGNFEGVFPTLLVAGVALDLP